MDGWFWLKIWTTQNGDLGGKWLVRGTVMYSSETTDGWSTVSKMCVLNLFDLKST